MRESDRAGVIGQVAEKRLRRREAAERLGLSRPSGEAAAGALPRAGAVGSGFGASGQAVEQRHGGSGAARGDGTGARALPGLRPDIRAREAGGGARSSAVGGDAAPVDDRGWPVAGEGAAGDAGAPESAAAGLRGGPGADRRLAARLVRGSRAGVRADRVRRRRDDAAAGDGVLRRGDDRGVHADDAGAFGGPRPAGGVLLGPPQRVPGQQKGQGGRADAVLAGFADAGYRGDPRAQPASEGARRTGEQNASGPAGEGDAAPGNQQLGGGQRVPAGVHGGLQPALRGGAAEPGGRPPRGSARRGGAGPDLLPAPPAQADEEPDHQVRVPRVPGDGSGQGLSPARRGGDGVQGLRRLGDGAARGPRAAGAAAGEGRGADSGGGRQDRARARRRGEGGAAGAAGLQAAAGPSLAATTAFRQSGKCTYAIPPLYCKPKPESGTTCYRPGSLLPPFRSVSRCPTQCGRYSAPPRPQQRWPRIV